MPSKGGLIYHLTCLLYVPYIGKTRKITSSAVKKHHFELLVFYLSITFVSHTRSQKMLSVCMHACSQLLSPIVDGRVNNVLLQTVPDVNEAQLQLIDTVHVTFMIHILSAA